MPFITEEIWHILADRAEGESVMNTRQPEPQGFDQSLIDKFSFAEEVIMAIRNVRKERNIPQKEAISLFIRKNNNELADTTFDGVAGKLCNVNEDGYVDEKVENCVSFVVRSTEFFIPLQVKINAEEEIAKLEEELNYTQGFLGKVMQKLENVRFVNSAPPAVVASERKKQEDAEGRIRVLEEQIRGLRG
jgi:valyl-tRNA synthetase